MPGSQKILIVDDEPDLVELLAYNFQKEGFAVRSAGDGEQAMALLNTESFDLIVLDVMLPGIQGMDLLRELRARDETTGLPVLMLTARGEEMDRVLGLELGADDYVTKPFSVREVIARVKAILRRARQAPRDGSEHSGAEPLVYGDLVIDPASYTVTKKGTPLKLSATEFRLLHFLVARNGKVFTRDQLLDAVWRNEAYVEPRTVDVHIRRLRSQIEDDPAQPRYIRTRRGIGYFADGDL